MLHEKPSETTEVLLMLLGNACGAYDFYPDVVLTSLVHLPPVPPARHSASR